MLDYTVQQIAHVDRALLKNKGKAFDMNDKPVTIVVTAILNKAEGEGIVGYSAERPGKLHFIYVDEYSVLRWSEVDTVDNINLEGRPSNDLGNFFAERNRITADQAFGASFLSHVKLVTNDGRSWSAGGVFKMGEYEKLLAQIKRKADTWHPTAT